MNKAEILKSCGGYVKIGITGDFIERFLNMCAANNIYIWDVRIRGEKTAAGKVSVKGFKKLRKICKATHTRVHITARRGVPFFMKRLALRKGLLAGLGIFIILILWLCSHVWYIEIGGDGEIPQEEMLELLDKSGIRYGMPLKNLDAEKAQAEILSNSKKLAWVWTEKRGTKIYVDYRKRVEKPEILPVTPCNLVAARSGKITSILIKSGRTAVEKDMYVSEGQLLAGGILDSKTVGMRLVHSDGEVFADTNRSISEKFSLVKTTKIPTGRKKSSIGIKFGANSYYIPIKKYSDFEKTEKEFHFKIGDIYFPISFVKSTYYEVYTETVTEEKEKIIEKAKEYLRNSLQNSSKNVIIIEESFFVTEVDENTLEVTMKATCNEQIAQKQLIAEEEEYGGATD